MKDGVFSSIQDDNTAYWLGFMAADFSVSKRPYHMQFGLCQKDREHLEKFKQFIQCSAPINDRSVKCSNGKFYPSSYLSFCNKQIYQDLINLYHIVPNKSHFDIDFLQYIPEEYKMPFIFGYFDGDGTITFTDKSISVGFCGCKSLMLSISNYLSCFLFDGTSMTVLQDRRSDINFYFYLHKLFSMQKFLQLYVEFSDRCNLLERKLQIARNLLQYFQNQGLQRQNIKNNKQGCEGHRHREKLLYSKVCKQCGKQFVSVYNQQKYCSYECAHRSSYRCEHPDREQLKYDVRNFSFEFLGRKYGVDGNSIRKWCDSYSIPRRKSDINKLSDYEWELI